MKLWQKNIDADAAVDSFTVGRDREMDLLLARADVLGSMAHTRMLNKVGLLADEDLGPIQRELHRIYQDIDTGRFAIEEGTEDVHSQVESLLTQRIGDAGKKIHSGRSRNDQVLVDLRIFLRGEIAAVCEDINGLFALLQELSEKYREVLMPGYTHMQVAMPSSFGLWFGAYGEALTDDVRMLLAAYRVCNRNPLGSAAGYGSSFPLDRRMTTDLLGFDSMCYNVVYAQMGRGKTERIVAQALSSVASTLSRLAGDNVLYLSQNFGFISYPAELTTGSSIMPHKKNPDVWEIMRGKCNLLQGLPNQVTLLASNLPLGYNRDLQLLKEVLFPAIATLRECIGMAEYMLRNISVREDILDEKKYDYIFSVEAVNNMVLEGTPFREAYRTVGEQIESGSFSPSRRIDHTHAGSIGNPCNDQIAAVMQEIVSEFGFRKAQDAEKALVEFAGSCRAGNK
ncbi:MAG: argininosuccinate lyase [Rikenellaceae bacterium]|nr:argininosuccinate lyase [Rikenellaceae bacterium]